MTPADEAKKLVAEAFPCDGADCFFDSDNEVVHDSICSTRHRPAVESLIARLPAEIAGYPFPKCRCGNEMPAGMHEGMACMACIMKHTITL